MIILFTFKKIAKTADIICFTLAEDTAIYKIYGKW